MKNKVLVSRSGFTLQKIFVFIQLSYKIVYKTFDFIVYDIVAFFITKFL